MERVDGVVVAADALGHTFGVRVQRGRLTGLRPEGCGRLMAAGCVEGLRKKVLRIDGPFRAQGFLSLTALRAEGCGIALSGDEYYNAAFRRSRPHRVSYSFLPSYIPTSLDGVSLDSRVAGLPYESSSLAIE